MQNSEFRMKGKISLRTVLKFCILYSAFFISLFSGKTTAQDASAPSDSTKHHKVLLIPYNPMMHLSDADNDIAEYSGKDQETLRKMFRMGLTQRINGKIFEVYDSQSLLTEYAKGNDDDLDMIYGSIGYSMENVIPLKKDSVDSKGKKVKAKKEEKHDSTYMNVKLSHPELLKALSEKYGADLFVFINQFEIKTDYNDCINFQLKIYEREIKVHFSVFDKYGKQLAGDVAVSLFPSNSNDPGEIMTGNFPSISSYIANSLKQQNR